MCGIVGYVGPKEVVPLLVRGLERLEYRGYDSSGLALQHNGKLTVVKSVGKIKALNVFNKTTGRWTNHVAINGGGAMPSTWTLRAGEKFVQGSGHAEETILANLGPDEIVGFGMRFGGAGYFGGRADKTPFSYFWQEDW